MKKRTKGERCAFWVAEHLGVMQLKLLMFPGVKNGSVATLYIFYISGYNDQIMGECCSGNKAIQHTQI